MREVPKFGLANTIFSRLGHLLPRIFDSSLTYGQKNNIKMTLVAKLKPRNICSGYESVVSIYAR